MALFNLADHIEQTLLKPDAVLSQIDALVQGALQHKFKGVCVNSRFVAHVSQQLKNSAVKTVAVVGFPLGAAASSAKAFEAEHCVRNGAQEIDMVLSLGALKENNQAFALKDIKEVLAACGPAQLKVIIETSLLTEEEKIRACQWVAQSGAHFIKTCTGFAGGGATVADIQLMKKYVNGACQIKASGGIKTAALAQELLAAGAHRLGTSAGIELLAGQTQLSGY